MPQSDLPVVPPSRSAPGEQLSKFAGKHKFGRYPLALRRELEECITELEIALRNAALQMTWPEALRQYRASRRVSVRPTAALVAAAYGIQGPLRQSVVTVARDLDKAFQRIHTYEAKDNLTQGVSIEFQRANARRPREKRREEKLLEIGLWLRARGYAEAADKAYIVSGAMRAFDCGETDVRDAARGAGLTRKYRKSTK